MVVNFDSRRVQLVLALRKAGITDSKVMAVMESIPRNIFLAPIKAAICIKRSFHHKNPRCDKGPYIVLISGATCK